MLSIFCSYLSLRYAGNISLACPRRYRTDHLGHAGDASAGRAAVWLTGRPLRRPRAVDGERDLFFRDRTASADFAPNYTTFLLLRAMFGIGMGGEWGVGASLAMEAAPKRLRGVLSGLLAKRVSDRKSSRRTGRKDHLAALGWRPVFWVGALPALLALYIRTKVPESKAWKGKSPGNDGASTENGRA